MSLRAAADGCPDVDCQVADEPTTRPLRRVSERAGESACPPSGVVAHNVAAIAALEQSALAQRTPSECVADRIAQIAGSPAFAGFHFVWFTGWVVQNTGLVPRLPVFDRFPFSFLTLVVSLEAIFLSLAVLVSQNRLTRQAERRAHLELQINLLAEQESTRTVALLERIADQLGLNRGERDDGELATPTDIEAVVAALDQTLPAKP